MFCRLEVPKHKGDMNNRPLAEAQSQTIIFFSKTALMILVKCRIVLIFLNVIALVILTIKLHTAV
jgi:hypothetical protein